MVKSSQNKVRPPLAVSLILKGILRQNEWHLWHNKRYPSIYKAKNDVQTTGHKEPASGVTASEIKAEKIHLIILDMILILKLEENLCTS